MEVKGNTILITGGGSGIGASCAKYLASLGAKICLLDVNEENLEKVANEIEECAYVVCDVSNEEQIESSLNKLAEEMGIPKVCINCAGIVHGARVIGKDNLMSLLEFKRVLDINVAGTFNVLKALTNLIVNEQNNNKSNNAQNNDMDNGVIINLSSIAAFDGQIGQAAYSASKGAIAAMTLPLAREFAKFNIRVMAIAPGLIDTPMMASLPEKARNNLIESTVYPKRFGHAIEIAKLCEHIIENSLLNGEVIRADGAVRMGP